MVLKKVMDIRPQRFFSRPSIQSHGAFIPIRNRIGLQIANQNGIVGQVEQFCLTTKQCPACSCPRRSLATKQYPRTCPASSGMALTEKYRKPISAPIKIRPLVFGHPSNSDPGNEDTERILNWLSQAGRKGFSAAA